MDMFIALSFTEVYTQGIVREKAYTVCPGGLNSWHGVLAILKCNYSINVCWCVRGETITI